MPGTATAVANKTAWVDLTTSDVEGAREFYSKLFGWQTEVNPDPQYGGYALAKIGAKQVGGIAPRQSPESPTAWALYIGTDDIDDLAKRAATEGGTVVMAPFDVGDQGRMAVFQDPSGAFVSAWQPLAMRDFVTDIPSSFGWAELNARGVDRAIPFYEALFGWTTKVSPMGEGQPPYTELQLDGKSVAGAWEMSSMVPAQVPSYWMVYFNVEDVDRSFIKAIDAGATEMLAPQDYPGGRFAIVSDPQGASFGLLKSTPR